MARLALGGVTAGILVVPFVAGDYYATLMLPFFAYAVVLLGLNLLFGYTGLLSFGHSLFIGIGAYTAAFLTSQFGVLHLEVILLVAALASALVAIPVGAICVRYVRIYFAMLTLAFGMLFYSFLLKFYYVTGGDEGMRVLQPFLLGVDLSAMPKIRFLTGPYYYYCFALLALATLLMWRIVSSPFGLCLRSIRDNPTKAEFLGVGTRRYRWLAFLISAAYAGVGGALLGPTTGQVDPTLAYWTHSGLLVFMTLLGGFANFFGPLVGALVFIFLQDAVMSVVPYWRLVFGAILALLVIAAPGGLMGLLDAGAARWGEKARRAGATP
jgi:branched-chain amino acid transport system permease protein